MNSETLGPIRRILAVGGVALAGGVALTGCGALEDAVSDDSTTDTEVSNAQLDAAADAAVGDCMPEEVLVDQDVFSVDCGGADAFWTITAIEADPGLSAPGGTLPETDVFALCGEENGAQVPGKTWTDWNMIYDEMTGEVNYLFCLEATGNPTAAGATPVVPSAAGECFSSAEPMLGTYPCDSPDVDSTVVSVIEIDQAEWATADTAALAAECDSSYTLDAVDFFGRTAAVFCID
ncbi:hypothetical protein [Glycomyces paridis]|uniref:Septum formation-related domain-containing protein n=1 Tax=Glycomyces paridis TaxID=2126555 RepID=A0A4S8PCN9_9ACTN|nr:hypothetical protein [Glycomyces paridis]THV27551.1 hypothetical protein E9998_14150 [Glycomyces paridis]